MNRGRSWKPERLSGRRATAGNLPRRPRAARSWLKPGIYPVIRRPLAGICRCPSFDGEQGGALAGEKYDGQEDRDHSYPDRAAGLAALLLVLGRGSRLLVGTFGRHLISLIKSYSVG